MWPRGRGGHQFLLLEGTPCPAQAFPRALPRLDPEAKADQLWAQTGTLVKRGPWPCGDGDPVGVPTSLRATWAGFWVGMLTNNRCPGDPQGHAEGPGAGEAPKLNPT